MESKHLILSNQFESYIYTDIDAILPFIKLYIYKLCITHRRKKNSFNDFFTFFSFVLQLYFRATNWNAKICTHINFTLKENSCSSQFSKSFKSLKMLVLCKCFQLKSGSFLKTYLRICYFCITS